MKALLDFLKSTLVTGVLFLLPFLLTLVLLRHGTQMVAEVLQPLAKLSPVQKVGGVLIADLLGIATLLVICFVAGLFMATQAGRSVSKRMEGLALRRLPGYTFFQSLTRGLTGLEKDSELGVGLIRLEDGMWAIGFVVEKHTDGNFTVFIPSAPTPAVGTIYVIEANRLRLLDVSVSKAITCIVRMGVGSTELLRESLRS